MRRSRKISSFVIFGLIALFSAFGSEARAGLGIGGGLLYSKINTDKVASKYTDLGFTAPSRQTLGFTAHFFHQFSGGFRLGVDGGTLVADTRKTETTELAFGIGYGGLTMGWVRPRKSFTPTFELFAGIAESALALETSTSSARQSKMLLMIRPAVGFEFNLLSYTRLGLKASAMSFPKSFQTRVEGADLGVTATPGLTYAFRAELMFGSF